MVNLNIGQKIQRYRNQRGLSLRGLAEKTGITASMISQIENNSVNPSINTLKTLAETLDFPLYVLFQEENDPEQELIVRKGEYRSIGNRNSEVAYNLLTADTRGSIEFVLMEIPPQTFTADKEHHHTGEETSYVEYGDVDIWLNGEKFRLHAGDAVRIRDAPPLVQSWRRDGPGHLCGNAAQLLIFMFGSAPSRPPCSGRAGPSRHR